MVSHGHKKVKNTEKFNKNDIRQQRTEQNLMVNAIRFYVYITIFKKKSFLIDFMPYIICMLPVLHFHTIISVYYCFIHIISVSIKC